MSKVLTDKELRAHWSGAGEKKLTVAPDVLLTPAAQDFIREHGIVLERTPPSAAYAPMTRRPIPVREGQACYIDARTGEEIHEKAEEMTHLRENILVPKTHPQIAFRGALDTLMARFLLVELCAREAGEDMLADDLRELLGCVRRILGAEVKDEPMEEMCLLGMNSQEIRRASHFVRETLGIEHPIPTSEMGRVCVELNALRAQVRETELSAARAFENEETGRCRRADIVETLNRLSSCVYILFCRKLAGYYARGKRP